ncbi:hypothetical protein N0B30_22600 (plasmid) [Bacillus subtilis]|uniref:hypothetical protein n=1 Tax=Bacillus subtilis group TaxID=653685 RepID=UPI001319DE05|nr:MULTISPECIES: hypothetical protein [Bacillus subtilis group]MCT6515422.1 hypothetical protein [Bacillus subtilis]MEC0407593.1 hypothetical protein [Bacillus subtilis]MEC0419528.1 hypothetical protein [Bacillus subtilis]MEC0436846.1 hypothetical protein [Bacillus subtilis]MEC0449051.1 hypothetical protein [Bacillus subtilis]
MSENYRKHPDDPEGNWDYNSCPDIEEYFDRDGNLDRYDKDYDKWEEEQYKQQD